MSLNSGRTALKSILPLVSRTSAPAQAMPSWITEAESAKQSLDRQIKLREEFERNAMNVASTPEVPAAPASNVQGVMYDVWIGANVKMFSSAKAEAELYAMRTQNHWDLPISRAAARVADFLWPDCQTVVDEAMAKTKVMKNTRGIEPDDVYMAPKVPEFLPITHWVANNDSVRSSFVCDKTTTMRPRMTWYNPNDGMVPVGWLRDGLLADLAYYKPFSPPAKA